MKIILDCERMKYPYTGLNTFCAQLSQAMMNTIKPEDELSFFVNSKNDGFMGADKRYILQNFTQKYIPLFHLNKLDIWHTTYQLSKYSGGGFSTKRVMTIHDLNFLYEKKIKTNKYISKHQKNINKVDHIVAISEYVKNDILKHLDVKGKPVSVVHNGFKVQEYTDFNTPNYHPKKPFILSIGVINAKKNFHVLPSILKNNDFEIIIAGKPDGDNSYKNIIENEAKRHGVIDRVHILGPISDEDKYWYLKNCAAFAFPSIAEGFGLPVLEAMHFGKPVFLSSDTSLPEIGGKEAYYFKSFEAEDMQSVFEDGMNDFINNNKQNAIIAHSKQFSWEKAALEYYKIYNDLL